MNIPKQFEYVDVLYCFKNRPEVTKFVTVLDEFEHHYTGTKFYRIRIEYVSYVCEGSPSVEYDTVQEDRMVAMLEKRKVG